MNSIYILLCLSLPYRHKIGISRNAEKRRGQIDQTVRGKVYRLLSVPIPNAKRVEKRLHKLLAFLHAPIKKRNGRTNGEKEWFWVVNPWTIAALVFFAPNGWWLVGLLPIPFDTISAVIIISFSIWAVIAGIVCGAAYLALTT